MTRSDQFARTQGSGPKTPQSQGDAELSKLAVPAMVFGLPPFPEFDLPVFSGSFHMKHWVPVDAPRERGSVIYDACQLKELTRETRENPPSGFKESYFRWLWSEVGEITKHATQNAVEAVYDRVDRGEIAPEKGMVSLTVGLLRNPKPTLIIRLEDNGIGFPKKGLDELVHGRGFSTKNASWYDGDRGEAVSCYMMRCRDLPDRSFQIYTHSKDGQFVLTVAGREDGSKIRMIQAARELPPGSCILVRHPMLDWEDCRL